MTSLLFFVGFILTTRVIVGLCARIVTSIFSILSCFDKVRFTMTKNVKVILYGEKETVEIIAKYFAIKDDVKQTAIYRIAGREFHRIDKVEFFEVTSDGYTLLATVNVDNTHMKHNAITASDKSTFTFDRSQTKRGDKSKPLTVENIDIGTDIETITSAVFDKLNLTNKPQSELKRVQSENDALKDKLDKMTSLTLSLANAKTAKEKQAIIEQIALLSKA